MKTKNNNESALHIGYALCPEFNSIIIYVNVIDSAKKKNNCFPWIVSAPAPSIAFDSFQLVLFDWHVSSEWCSI